MENQAPHKLFKILMLFIATGLALALIYANAQWQRSQSEELIDYAALTMVDRFLESGILIPPVDYNRCCWKAV